MFTDLLVLHDDCEEVFIDFASLAGTGEQAIACAGISTLRTAYRIGRAEV